MMVVRHHAGRQVNDDIVGGDVRLLAQLQSQVLHFGRHAFSAAAATGEGHVTQSLGIIGKFARSLVKRVGTGETAATIMGELALKNHNEAGQENPLHPVEYLYQSTKEPPRRRRRPRERTKESEGPRSPEGESVPDDARAGPAFEGLESLVETGDDGTLASVADEAEGGGHLGTHASGPEMSLALIPLHLRGGDLS